jgi:YVTN family beta-propeller protein
MEEQLDAGTRGLRRRPRRTPLLLAGAALLAGGGLVLAPGVAHAASGGSLPVLRQEPAGPAPVAEALDPATQTLYVADSAQAASGVAVLSTACSGGSSPCGGPVTEARAGQGPDALALASGSGPATLYVANADDNTVSVLGAATCDASDQSGCSPVATVSVGTAPSALAYDSQTQTLYVANEGSDTVSVLDAATCDASDQSGCGQTPASLAVGAEPRALALDTSSGTLYVADKAGDEVSVVATSGCPAGSTSCPSVVGAIPLGTEPDALAVTATGQLAVTEASADQVALLETANCHSGVTNGCGAVEATASLDAAPSAVVAAGQGAGSVLDVTEEATDEVAVVAAVPSSAAGYWLVGRDGGVFSFGDAGFDGSVPGLPAGVRPSTPVVGMAATPAGGGYWVVTSAGDVYSFGDARFFGSLGNTVLSAPIVGMVATPDGGGYWLVGRDGGVFSFGDARFYGSVPGLGIRLAPGHQAVGVVASPDGLGYWVIAQDGGVFSFGDAPFEGSEGGVRLAAPIVGAAGAIG